MDFKRKIIWTIAAEEELDNILNYLEQDWNIKVRNKFASEFHKNINYILANPYQFPPVNKSKNYHKCVITKHNTIFYRILDKTTIQILHIFDTRQNPNILKKDF